MNKKFDLLSFLAKNWWYYVLWALLVIFVWEIAFTIITKPKDEESVYLFFGVESARTDEMNAYLQAVKPDYVKHIDVTAYSTATKGFDYLFATRGQLQTDIFVLPESYCDPSVMTSTFYPMDISAVKEIFGEDAQCDKAVFEGKAYGVKIYDKNTDTGKGTTYLNYTYTDNSGVKTAAGDYYLFFGKKSLHLGKLSGGSFSGALVIAQAIWKN